MNAGFPPTDNAILEVSVAEVAMLLMAWDIVTRLENLGTGFQVEDQRGLLVSQWGLCNFHRKKYWDSCSDLKNYCLDVIDVAVHNVSEMFQSEKTFYHVKRRLDCCAATQNWEILRLGLVSLLFVDWQESDIREWDYATLTALVSSPSSYAWAVPDMISEGSGAALRLYCNLEALKIWEILVGMVQRRE